MSPSGVTQLGKQQRLKLTTPSLTGFFCLKSYLQQCIFPREKQQMSQLLSPLNTGKIWRHRYTVIYF